MIWRKSALGFWLSAYPKGCSTEIPDSRDKLGEGAMQQTHPSVEMKTNFALAFLSISSISHCFSPKPYSFQQGSAFVPGKLDGLSLEYRLEHRLNYQSQICISNWGAERHTWRWIATSRMHMPSSSYLHYHACCTPYGSTTLAAYSLLITTATCASSRCPR